MENLGLGAGMAAMAFWGFVAVACVAGIWNGIRKREAKHETLRRMIESGQTIDQELLEKLSLLSDGRKKRVDRDFKVAGLWILPAAVGVAIFGIVLSIEDPSKLIPLLGVSALIGVVGAGCLVAAKITASWHSEDNGPTSHHRKG